jgi:ferritin
MKEIKMLMEHIEDELRDAHTYAELAMEYREEDLETAELFYKLSGEEVGHMEALHRATVRRIEKYRREKGEPPADMMAVYEYLHRRAVRKAEEVGILQAMFKK